MWQEGQRGDASRAGGHLLRQEDAVVPDLPKQTLVSISSNYEKCMYRIGFF